MIDRTAMRLSALLLVAGELLSVVAGIFNPARENTNDHQVVFAEYAASTQSTTIHLGQFVGIAALIAGMVVLFFALHAPSRASRWASRFGAASGGVALALYG